MSVDSAVFGAYFTISFVLALRGNETLMLDLKALIEYFQEGLTGEIPHVVVPLLDQFKGEDYQRHHLLLAPNMAGSGFEPRKWLDYLIQAQKAEGIITGPAFTDGEGYVLTQQPLNDELSSQLIIAKDLYPSLFPSDLKLDDINTSRTFRKGSTSRAQNLELKESTIDANNRWRSFNQAKGSRPNLKLRNHYSSTKLMAKKILAYPLAV